MKLYSPKPKELIRLEIRKPKDGDKKAAYEYFSLEDTTIGEVVNFVKNTLMEHVNPFPEGKRTSITVRRAVGGSNKEGKSISYYGLSPLESKKILIEALESFASKKLPRVSVVLDDTPYDIEYYYAAPYGEGNADPRLQSDFEIGNIYLKGSNIRLYHALNEFTLNNLKLKALDELGLS